MNMKESKFRRVWLDYRGELVFGLVLVLLLVLSYWLTPYIITPEIWDTVLWPVCTGAFIVVSFTCAWICYRHHEHNRMRLAWILTLVLWCLAEIVMFMTYILGDTTMVAGTEELSDVVMIVGGVFGLLLFVYPFCALSPNWFNVKRFLFLLSPLPVMCLLVWACDIDLRVLIGAYPVWLLAILLYRIHKYEQWCEANFSSLEYIDTQWFVRYFIMLLLAGFSFLWLCLSHEPTRAFTQDMYLIFILIYTTDRVLSRPDPWTLVHSTVAEEDAPAQQEQMSISESDEISEDRQKLDQWMRTTKAYLNPDLQLSDLRQALPLNRTYISRLLNNELQCTFFQFVNEYRIEEAKRLMEQNPQMKIQDVAQQSGFSSRPVFTQSFLRATGMTPSKWLKILNAQKV